MSIATPSLTKIETALAKSKIVMIGATPYPNVREAAQALRIPPKMLERMVVQERLSGVALLRAYFQWRKGETTKPLTGEKREPIRIGNNIYTTITAARASTGVSKEAYYFRTTQMGWSQEDALMTPMGQKLAGAKQRQTFAKVPVKIGELDFETIAAACRHFNTSPNRVHKRLLYGWPLTMALTDATNLSLGEQFRETVEYGGNNYPSVYKACKALSVPYPQVLSQMSFGATFDVAVAVVAQMRLDREA